METLRGLATETWATFASMAPYLLLGLSFTGILHVLFRKDFIARHLGADSVSSVVKAALLGVPLPLCSCGVIPTALSLRKSRASEGAVMSFLISTPQTGVDSIIATWGMLGPVFAVFRPLAALVMGIAGGLAVRLGRKETKGQAVDTAVSECVICNSAERHGHGWPEKLKVAASYAFGTFLDDISVQLAAGIVIAGLVAFFVPEGFFAEHVGTGVGGMALMIAVGIPMYVCATASIPIAMALMMKGVSPGAAFVFLSVGPATNAATVVLVTHTMGKRFTAVYLVTMVVGALAAGSALDAVFGAIGNLEAHSVMFHSHHAEAVAGTWWMSVSVYVFLAALTLSLGRKTYRRLRGVLQRRPLTTSVSVGDNVLTVGIEGMTCSHCASHVRQVLQTVSGARRVTVDLKSRRATISGSVSTEAVREAIRKAGYRPL